MVDSPDEMPALDLLARMTADSLEVCNLDDQTLMLVRLAALVALDAPAASYMANLGAAAEAGVTQEMVQGVLVAVAPLVGTTHVLSAVGKIADVIDLVAADIEEEMEAED
jgi:alkylhydroperoxidase/carboxymuconolactone decarboxylase family protein YurZ